MKIRVDDIQEEEKLLDFREDVVELNEVLAGRGAADFQLEHDVDVSVGAYRAGSDLFFHGRFGTPVRGTCARCLESFPFRLDREFSLVLKPATEATEKPGERADPWLAFYKGDEVDLSPFVREELLLAMPTRALCNEACAGLCSRCGANLNLGKCGCVEEWTDPRLAKLREWKR
jgi:uncharacterized protein